MTNDRERCLLNGEIGIVTHASDDRMSVQFDGHKVAYQKSALTKNRVQGPTNHLDWANVVTVHKAQGSEFGVVIVPVTGSYSLMLLRNLYYTGVSRGRNKVIVLGEPEALEKAARNLRGTHRITKLAEFLNPKLNWPARAPDMGAVSYLELERKSEEEEAEEYLAALYAKQERLLAKFEAGEATEEEIQWLIEAGILVPVDPASEST